MSRKSAREHAFKLVFQMEFRDINELDSVIARYLEENQIIGDADYIKSCVYGVFNNIEEISGIVKSCLKNWSSERVAKIDAAIIRLCVYEMLKMDDIPAGVSINEAILLAKKFGADDSPAFINGVLGAAEKEIINCAR